MNIERSQGIITTGGKVDIHNPTLNFSPPSPIQPVKQFRYRDNPNFVGREAQLTELHQQLQHPEIVAITAVAGMTGVGKTELASHYSHKHESEYPGGICWLDARGENLAAAVVQFAQLDLKLEVPQIDFQGKPLNLTQQVVWCWQNWQPPEGLVLVILDDVTDLAHCRDFFPTSNRFRVLITTRLRHLDTNIREIPLDVLLPKEALQLLTVLEPKRVQREPETAQELCKWLGYLPLGIDLVGRYLAKKPPQWTLAKMLERLKTQSIEDEALNQELYKTLSTAQRGVKAAFELSWQELEPQTQKVAEFLSLFAPSMFAWEWVEAAANGLNWHSAEVETANQQLYECHLIQWVEDREDGYKIHPLIREFFKAKLNLSPQAEDLKQVFVSIFVAIAEKIPDTPTLEFINFVNDAIPNLAEIAENLLDVVSDENLIWVFVGLGRFYKGQGLYTLAEPWYTQCVLVLKSRLGEKNRYVAASLHNLAELYHFQGRYKEAEPLYGQALALYKRVLGEEHPDIALSINNLAELYRLQGRYEEAEPLYSQALDLCKRVLGEEHPNVAIFLNNLALLYHSQGRYKDAEPLLQQVLKLSKHLSGEEHLNVALRLNNLAGLYRSQGRYEEAEPLLAQAFALYKRLLGEEHPYVVFSLNNRAELYNLQGRYEEAEPLYRQALDLCKCVLGEEHPHVAICLNNLAVLYNSQRRYEEAEPLLAQALKLRKHIFGEEHPSVAVSLNCLAELYRLQGRYEEAEPFYQQALTLNKRLLGEEHPDVALSLNNLALLYDNQGRDEEAEPLYLQALTLNKRVLGEEHPNVALSLNNLALLYDTQRQYEKAEPLYEQALAIAKQKLGRNHPTTEIFRNNLESLRKKRQSE
ncbi:tetratricopeptide repeat protein [Trichormus variabilis]|uniref:NB-ARC domain-containing protein n=1 Tax=Trichormus variabilis SAG 1403-4b TaxID=447716 RepID=A0A3S1BTV9_ANAVA|nr:tetratricopeptide repeat protein [Trichormus variabilis]RUS94805.1 hypothetical protein DSM107003_34820 [Trichormus variabilis SAG 1403-4b]